MKIIPENTLSLCIYIAVVVASLQWVTQRFIVSGVRVAHSITITIRFPFTGSKRPVG